ncbi:MAG: hypothetical protein MUC58_05645 [Rhizobiaceae bacterium]|jgi:hypothetical protein|nr:hypothetical protein [Rhizobiaceae bacterium]
MFDDATAPVIRLAAVAATAFAIGVLAAVHAPAQAAQQPSAVPPCTPVAGVPCASVAPLPAMPRSAGPLVQGKVKPDALPRGFDPKSVQGDPRSHRSTFTFFNRNSSGYDARLRIFSKSRNWVWPGPHSAWVMRPDRVQRVVRISCIRGERVCYGAWRASNPHHYWGVGAWGSQPCWNCCYTCNGGYAAVNFVR